MNRNRRKWIGFHFGSILKCKIYVMQMRTVDSHGINRMGKINETGRSTLGREVQDPLCATGGNHIPKYLLPVYRPHRYLSISGNGTNHERAIISRNLDSDGAARRDVPSKFTGSGFGGD